MSLQAQIKDRALEGGFDLAGIAPITAWQDLEFAKTWYERGFGGEMTYLKNLRRADPHLILPSVKSIVCVGLIYNTPLPYSVERDSGLGHRDHEPRAPSREPRNGPRAWISRYAWGRDYHQAMRARLEHLRAGIEELAPGVETRVYVDTGPIVERAFARLSGIGWMGKNTCLINQQKGSWFFIGVVLTSLEIDPDPPAFDRCGSCRRCLDACPTGALVEPYVMDASRCIAYLNIELKGSIPADLRPAVGANLFGCDICQDVCPWNRSSGLGARVSGDGPSFAVGSLLPPAEDGNSKVETRKSEFGNAKTRRRAPTTQIPQFYPLTINRADALRTTNNRQLRTDDETQTTNDEPRTAESRVPATADGQLLTDHEQPRTNNAQRTTKREPLTWSLFNPKLEDLTSFSEDDFRRVFRDSPVKRVKYRGWLRNLCVAIGNSSDPRFLPWLERMRLHADGIVREHAEWAIDRLRQLPGPADGANWNAKRRPSRPVVNSLDEAAFGVADEPA